jgi:heterodisulfide reductase subunit A
VAEEKKTGVFLCKCGGEISDAIELETIADQVRERPDTSLVEIIPHACGPVGEERIRQAIGEGGFDRLLIAGCSPRIMEKRFSDLCQDAGLQDSTPEIVNVLDHCVRVHKDNPEAVNGKAQDLIRMGLARASTRGAAGREKAEIISAVLVVGGGVAGMTAALTLAEKGIHVKLIERESELGGLAARRGDVTASGLAERVQQSANVQIFTGAEIAAVSGSYGNYDVKFSIGSETKRIMVGAAILAMGAREDKPQGHLGYGVHENVITQLELEQRLRNENYLDGIKNIVVIHCHSKHTNGKLTGNPLYGTWAVNNAIQLKNKNPDASIHILHDEPVHGSGLNGRMQEEAKSLGISFLQMQDETVPEVTPLAVSAQTNDGEQVTLACDLAIVSAPLVPWESSCNIASSFGIPVDEFGFLVDTLPSLKPDQYAEPCVHVAGSAHWPCSDSEAMSQAYGRAIRIAALIEKREVDSSLHPAAVDVDACRGCSTCRDHCPFDVPVIKECGHRPVAHSTIDPFLCKACGSCVVHCPTGAITMENLAEEMFQAEIEAALNGGEWAEVKALAFVCEWSGYAVWDLIGARGLSLPPEVIPVRVPCSARISPKLILNAFQSGADGVMMCACLKGDCHYLSGNLHAEQVFNGTAKLLGLLGLEESRFSMEFISPVEVETFQSRIENFASNVKQLGPSPFGKASVAEKAGVS